MFCKNCGNSLNEGDKFCNSCGTPIEVDTPKESITSEPVTTEPIVETPVVNESVVDKPIEPVINSVPEIPKKKSKAWLVILLIGIGVLFLGGIIFGVIKVFQLSKNITYKTETNEKTNEKETYTYEGYTFTIPDGFSLDSSDGDEVIGNSKFKFQLLGVDDFYSYSDYISDSTIETVKQYVPESTAKFLKQSEETYNGKKFLIFSFKRGEYYADATVTELSDGNVLMIFAYYGDQSNMADGYNKLAKFVTSATKETSTTETTEETKTDSKEDYMVIGDDTLGYVKLPGSWFKGKIVGSTDSSLQYFQYNNGKYIVTLDVLDKTKYTDAKASRDTFETAFRSDSDITNIRTESAKMGKYDAYKVYVQYKSDSVWVVSWFFKAEDGLIHMIQVEGLNTSHDNFSIPNTFSLTKIN